MNINVNSWHYRLVKNVTFRDSRRGHVPTSLCPYFRAVMYRVLFFTTVISGLIALFTAMGWPIGLAVMAKIGISGIFGLIGAGIVSCASIVGIFAIGVGSAICVAIGIAKIVEKIGEIRRDRRWAREDKKREDLKNGIEPKQPSIVIAFLKAKHDAVCPNLEFIDDKEAK